MTLVHVRNFVFTAAIVLSGMVLSAPHFNQKGRSPIAQPAGLGNASADGGSPVPTIPVKKPSSQFA